MKDGCLDPRLKLMQETDIRNKVVLLRVDHNVVKKGRIKDPYRIESTIGTLYGIIEMGGRPVLMTHISRPKDKKTGRIVCRESESVLPVVNYLEQRLPVKIYVPEFPVDPEKGILHIDKSIYQAIQDLKNGKIGMIYLPNTRWFAGEQSDGSEREVFAEELAGLADVFINDAFGSWQPHVSTYDIAKKMPAFAGCLLQKEIINLNNILLPERPFVGIIAGSKYDTKIGPLKAMYNRADYLVMGGLIYNAYLAAKYGVRIAGVSDEDRALAVELVEMDKKGNKIIEMSHVVESDSMTARNPEHVRTLTLDELKTRERTGYILDIDPVSFEDQKVREIIGSFAKTVFVNAVMGFMPLFFEGSEGLYKLIASNESALKMFGGGDTLQELKNLCPGIYLKGCDNPEYYCYFTGGGSVLKAIEQGSPYKLRPVEALMRN